MNNHISAMDWDIFEILTARPMFVTMINPMGLFKASSDTWKWKIAHFHLESKIFSFPGITSSRIMLLVVPLD